MHAGSFFFLLSRASAGLLMKAHYDHQNWSALRSLVADALRLDSGDVAAARYQGLLARLDQEIRDAEQSATSPETWLQLSLLYYRSGRLADCLRAAAEAIRLGRDTPRPSTTSPPDTTPCSVGTRPFRRERKRFA